MLDYSKVILERVSFDSQLFIKELHKALRTLKKNEAEEILLWCVNPYRNSVNI